MEWTFDKVYFEPEVMDYALGRMLKDKYADLPWVGIGSHNRIAELSACENRDFTMLKRHLVIGVRKTHAYAENHKVSDWLVPYTSSGCRAMCLYCYLVCNYNKCSYLRLFVNREQMLDKLLKTAAAAERPQTFEIGSNSDLVLENEITGNLCWTIEHFAREGRGHITFPTKFDMVQPLLGLDHRAKTIFRMSVNPDEIIRRAEFGTSPLGQRITALNAMAEAGYPVGLLIAPVILVPGWEIMYSTLIQRLGDELSPKITQRGFIEIILMTYSFVQNAINSEAFPTAEPIFDRALMTGRGRGKYYYRAEARQGVEALLRNELALRLPEMNIWYIA